MDSLDPVEVVDEADSDANPRKSKKKKKKKSSLKKRLARIESLFQSCRVVDENVDEEHVHDRITNLQKVEKILKKTLKFINKKSTSKGAGDKKKKKIPFPKVLSFFMQIMRIFGKFIPLFLAVNTFKIDEWLKGFLKKEMEESWDKVISKVRDYNEVDIGNDEENEKVKKEKNAMVENMKCFLYGNLDYVNDFCMKNFKNKFFEGVRQKIYVFVKAGGVIIVLDDELEGSSGTTQTENVTNTEKVTTT